MLKPISVSIFVFSLAVSGWFVACNSSEDVTDVTETDASQYANFGATLSETLPAGLKTATAGGSNKVFDISDSLVNMALSGDCATNFTNCPTISESGGGDSQTGEILMKIWGMDYVDACTEVSEICFHCPDCNTEGTWYRKPTMMSNDGTDCATTESSDIVAVNFGVDPCAFDSTVASIEMADCAEVEGTAQDISSILPWYASWNIPQNIAFSGFQAQGSGAGVGVYWSIVNSDNASGHYFVSLSDDWIHVGIKTRDATTGNLDEFLYIGAGSPDYYEGAGEDRGWNMSAYTGDIATDTNAATREVETYQSRSQGEHRYIQRTRINATHAYAQSWTNTDSTLPETDAEVATKKNNPSMTRCLEIGATVPASKYVPISDCVTAFGATDEADLNNDDNYRLKIFSEAALKAQTFSERLTTSTATACMN